jgi:hypothetical protein
VVASCRETSVPVLVIFTFGAGQNAVLAAHVPESFPPCPGGNQSAGILSPGDDPVSLRVSNPDEVRSGEAVPVTPSARVGRS